MEKLSLGIFAGSRKQDERRLPLHPRHIHRINKSLRERIFLEYGYGSHFGFSDADLAPFVGGHRTHDEIVAECDVLLQPKPLAADVAEMREGQVLWGWPHCVQDTALTQAAIDRQATIIAWEAMNHWNSDGTFNLHVFHKNNELAGYSSVLHALQLAGVTGQYGRPLRACVVGFGATGRGAVTALAALGLHEVSVLTQRDVAAVASPIHSVQMITFEQDPDRPGDTLELDGRSESVEEFLAAHDVIVNCVFQDTDAPLTLVTNEELSLFSAGTLFIDVSCDEGMGFEWARPTSFAEPTFKVGDGLTNYAVDHSPSFLWDSATWEISLALMPHLRTVMGGSAGWLSDEVIARAIEIRDGRIQNPKILTFQGRSSEFPHLQD
ncbi:MAG: N(5)-(carboxyethyl)ornithine synthase [Solirubrobacterales bacterium]